MSTLEKTQFNDGEFDITYVQEQMHAFFKVSDRKGMLPVLYKDFEKGHYADFCRLVAEGAGWGGVEWSEEGKLK